MLVPKRRILPPNQPMKEAEEIIAKLKKEMDITRCQLASYQQGYYTLVNRLEEIKNNLIKDLQEVSNEANDDLREINAARIWERNRK